MLHEPNEFKKAEILILLQVTSEHCVDILFLTSGQEVRCYHSLGLSPGETPGVWFGLQTSRCITSFQLLGSGLAPYLYRCSSHIRLQVAACFTDVNTGLTPVGHRCQSLVIGGYFLFPWSVGKPIVLCVKASNVFYFISIAKMYVSTHQYFPRSCASISADYAKSDINFAHVLCITKVNDPQLPVV